MHIAFPTHSRHSQLLGPFVHEATAQVLSRASTHAEPAHNQANAGAADEQFREGDSESFGCTGPICDRSQPCP